LRFQGREIDPIALWENYVEFPPNLKVDGEFLPKVRCPNPEHDTLKRHFQINVEKGLVHCFAGCGISGSFTRAISIIEGCTEREARKIVLRRGRTHSKGASRNSRDRNNHSRNGLGSDGGREEISSLEYSSYIPKRGIDFLNSRGITEESIATFGLGWDNEGLRVVIPAADIGGQIRFLIKRATREKDRPKYLYTEGFPKTSLLYGACDLDPRMIQSEGIVIVEGSIDRLVLWQHGIKTAVATLGTGISEIQARIVERFRPRTIYLMFDRDSSGVHGIEIARRRLPKGNLRVCRYPKERFDPAELQREEAYRMLERAVPISKIFNPNAMRRKVGKVKV